MQWIGGVCDEIRDRGLPAPQTKAMLQVAVWLSAACSRVAPQAEPPSVVTDPPPPPFFETELLLEWHRPSRSLSVSFNSQGEPVITMRDRDHSYGKLLERVGDLNPIIRGFFDDDRPWDAAWAECWRQS